MCTLIVLNSFKFFKNIYKKLLFIFIFLLSDYNLKNKQIYQPLSAILDTLPIF